MVSGMSTHRRRAGPGLGKSPCRKSRSRLEGFTLLEVVLAGAVLTTGFLAVHYSAALAWTVHEEARSRSESALLLWSRSSGFRAGRESGGTSLILHPDLRPLLRVVEERDGIEWETIVAR